MQDSKPFHDTIFHVFSLDGENWSTPVENKTVAILMGLQAYGEGEQPAKFHMANARLIQMPQPNPDLVINQIKSDLVSEVGDEAAGWLSDLEQQQKDMLSGAITTAIESVIKGKYPRFFVIENQREYVHNPEECPASVDDLLHCLDVITRNQQHPVFITIDEQKERMRGIVETCMLIKQSSLVNPNAFDGFRAVKEVLENKDLPQIAHILALNYLIDVIGLHLKISDMPNEST